MSKEDKGVLSRDKFISLAYRYDYVAGPAKLSLEKETIRLIGS